VDLREIEDLEWVMRAAGGADVRRVDADVRC
jgi:hypothetical protein